MMRILGLLGAVATLFALLASQVSAAKPLVVENVTFDPDVTALDAELSAACGFDIFATVKGHFRSTLYFDRAGNLVRIVSHPSLRETLTSEFGNSIETSDVGVDKLSLNPDGSLLVFGTGIHLKVKGDASAIGLWRLTFDLNTGDLLSAEYHGNFDLGNDDILDYLCDRLGP